MTKNEHPDEQKVDEQKVDERAKITSALQQALGQQDSESISISDLFKAINISGSGISGSAIGRDIIEP